MDSYKQINLFSGINPAKENCNRSFGALREIVKSLSQFGDIGMSNEEIESIGKCIDNSQKYLKNHFSYNLAMESDIGMLQIKC